MTSRGFLEAYVVYRNCKVNISSKELTILLDFFEFDVILGIDWLENYRAIIDCDDKIVTLHAIKKK